MIPIEKTLLSDKWLLGSLFCEVPWSVFGQWIYFEKAGQYGIDNCVLHTPRVRPKSLIATFHFSLTNCHLHTSIVTSL